MIGAFGYFLKAWSFQLCRSDAFESAPSSGGGKFELWCDNGREKWVFVLPEQSFNPAEIKSKQTEKS